MSERAIRAGVHVAGHFSTSRLGSARTVLSGRLGSRRHGFRTAPAPNLDVVLTRPAGPSGEPSKVTPARCERHALVLSLVLFGLLVVPGASAAARLISPPPGAVTNMHPVFTWELGPGESSDALYVARRPETTPEGAFPRENVVTWKLLLDGTLRTWSPTLGLFTGSYWWNVRTYDPELRIAYSAISSFTVAPSLRLDVRITRLLYSRELVFAINWVTNLRRVRLEIRVLRGRRLVDRAVGNYETFIAGELEGDGFVWEPPRSMRTGTRMRLIVRVSGPGKTATLTRQFRSP